MKMRIRFFLTTLVCIVLSSLNSWADIKNVAYHEIKRIPLTGAEGWDFLTFDSEHRHLYVTRSTHVAVVNLDSGKIIGDIPNTLGVHGVAFAPIFKRGFATNGKEGTVLVFNTESFKEEKRISAGTKPDAILYEPQTQTIWAFNGGSNDVSVIDAKSLLVLKTISLSGKPEVGVSDSSGIVYVNIEDKNEIDVLDAHKLSNREKWTLAPCEKPSGLSIDEESHRIFSVCDNKIMAITDSMSGKIVATVPIGNGPDGSAFDAKHKLAFSPNGKDGTLTIIKEISPDKFEVVSTVQTLPGARTIAIDSKTGNVILATAKDISPSPETRPKVYEAGSFNVLLFGS